MVENTPFQIIQSFDFEHVPDARTLDDYLTPHGCGFPKTRAAMDDVLQGTD